jgi:hypothetical protein
VAENGVCFYVGYEGSGSTGEVTMAEEKCFRTLRGFLAGDEPDDEDYFAYSAALRIFGQIADLDEITRNMELSPTRAHRAGERRGERSPPFEQDMWHYQPPVPEEEPLEKHIDALWTAIRDKKLYLLGLKETLSVDVFLGYRSNHDHAGVEVPYTCLEMFTELKIPFGLSIIVT